MEHPGKAKDLDDPEESGALSQGPSTSIDSLLRGVAQCVEPSGTVPIRSAGALVADRFRLERRLGEGGMGVVWEATHTVTRKPVALKFLKRSQEDGRAVHRFLREARAASAVRHPSVVEVHDVLELEDGSPVMVMELLQGETLAERLHRDGALLLPEVARIMVHVCSALGSAHALGIIHRDLKPENIFLVRSPKGSDVKVLDFGIAKLTATEGDAAHTGATTGTGAILGSPYYMAPEQLFAEKDLDHRADIWALGVILYEALSGVRPTQAPNMGQIYKMVMTDAIAPLRDKVPGLPRTVTDLVGRMLARDRAQRPADVGEVLSALSEHTDEAFHFALPPASRSPATALVAPSSRPGRRSLGVALLLAASGAAVLFALRRGPTQASTDVGIEPASSPVTVPTVVSPLPEAPQAEVVVAAAPKSSEPSPTPSTSAAPRPVPDPPRAARPSGSMPVRAASEPVAPLHSARPPTDPASYQ